MDYKLHYNNLITRSKGRVLDSYTEKHHIIPKCMGGSNDLSNIAKLTPEEHYVAHLLLVKIYPHISKLVCAANMMSMNLNGKRNNKRYAWVRRRFISQQQGENNTFFGKQHTDETKSIISIANTGRYLGKSKSTITKERMSKNSLGKGSIRTTTPAGIFASRKLAAEFYNVSTNTMYIWINKYPDKFQ